MADKIVCDCVCPVACCGANLSSPQKRRLELLQGREFMTIEFFREILFLGRQGISGTQMPSAQNSYSKVTYLEGMGKIS